MEYKLERQNRKTVSIRFVGGDVIVKAPLSTDIGQIERFITQKSGWIARKLAEYGKKTAEFARVVSGECMLYRGGQLPLVTSAEHKRVAIENGNIYVPQKYDGKIKYAVNAYVRRAADELEKRLREVSQITGLEYKSFALTNAKTKWGSCDGQCNIMLNWRLLMTEPWIIDYVIVHELSHTVYHDHGKAFWTTVEKFYKNFKAAKKRLKDYSILMPMYR